MKKLSLVVALLLSLSSICFGQQVVTPITPKRIYIELRDISLYNALELLFKGGGISDYRIDPSANDVFIKSIVLKDVVWEDALIRVTNSKGFILSRPGGKLYVVSPPNNN